MREFLRQLFRRLFGEGAILRLGRLWPSLGALLLAILIFLFGLWFGNRGGQEVETVPQSFTREVEVRAGCGTVDQFSAQLSFAIAALCGEDQQLSDDTLRKLKARECANSDQVPAVVYSPTGDEFLFASGMIIRFHPADSREIGVGYDPEFSPALALTPGAQVWVLDTGEHGRFVTSIVEEALDREGQAVDLDGTDMEAALKEAALDGAVLASPIFNVELPRVEPDVEGTFATESQLVDVLDALHLSDDVAKENMIINMSFGAYTCGEVPTALQAAMRRLAEHGVKFVASAGNDESDDKPYPAAFATDGGDDVLSEAVLSIGSISETSGRRSCFSNHGGVEAWFIGEEVESARPDGVTGRATWSGTSFSAPQATALLAAGRDPVADYSTTPSDPSQMFDVLIEVESRPIPGTKRQISGTTSCAADSGYLPNGAVVPN